MYKTKSELGVFLILSIMAIVVIISVSAMKPNFVSVTNTKSGTQFIIPEHAVEVADGVFSLGPAIDNGRIVEGYMFVDYKRQNAKPGNECGNGICEPGEKKSCAEDCGGNGGGESSCFSFLAKGAKWKTVEPYLVDPTNNAGLNEGFVRSNLASDIYEWEDAADGSVDGVQGADILGDENLSGIVNRETIGDLNGKNEVIFADISSSGAIAVTIVWGIFNGPPKGRELVEWDQIYDDADFDWSSDCTIENCTTKMDFENIAQHELGHSVGLGHPTDTCTEETMYAFASFGETKKRSLELGDITGVKKFYS